MTTITKERLQWLANISGRDDIDDIDGGEIRELARIALASLEQNALSGNSPLIPGEVLSAIREVARIRADFDDFDGDRRGIGDCLDEAEQELIVTINKYASQLAVEPVVPAVLERLRTIVADPRALPRRKEWVSGQQYSYVLLENVEAMVDEACHAATLPCFMGKESDMANSLLETCNNWQIQRAEILSRNPDMAMTIDNLDTLIERTVRSAIDIARRVDWDFREAERLAKEQEKAAGKGD